MNLSRRELVKSAGCAIAAAWCGSPLAAAAAKPRVRRDINGLAANDADVMALAGAIEQMRKLPPGDRRNWQNFAEIHGALKSRTMNKCRHGDWLFLPWHRAYLFSFELIVAKLSGHKEFALPFWNWEKDHELPRHFLGGMAIPAFSNPERRGDTGSGRKNPAKFNNTLVDHVSGKVIDDLLDLPDFEVFGGSSPRLSETGNLEGGPHNAIHAWIKGDMLRGGAPFDPVFWLHHCNVDRLWEKWARKHPKGNLNEPAWLNEKFSEFCDGDGKDFAAPLTVADAISSSFGYTYEGFKDATDMSPGAKISQATPAASLGIQDFKHLADYSFSPLNWMAKSNQGLLDAVDPKGPGTTIRVRMRGFQAKLPTNLSLEVYFAPQPMEKRLTPLSAGFIGAVYPGDFWDMPHEHVPSFVLDATSALRRVYRPQFDFNSICVQFVPRLDSELIREKAERYLPARTTIEVMRRPRN